MIPDVNCRVFLSILVDRKLARGGHQALLVDILKALVHLATSPLPKFEAHHCVCKGTFHFGNRMLCDILLDSTDMLDHLDLILSLGSDLDCCLVTEI
jgi:hypothetical protein